MCVSYTLLSVYEIHEMCFARIYKVSDPLANFWEHDGSYYSKCVFSAIMTVAEFKEWCNIIWITARGETKKEMMMSEPKKEEAEAKEEGSFMKQLDIVSKAAKKVNDNYGQYFINW